MESLFSDREGWTGDKALLAALLIMLTNPVSAHALAKAAFGSGVTPWRKDGPEGENKPGKEED